MRKVSCDQVVRRNGKWINGGVREERIRVVPLLHTHKDRVVSGSERIRVTAVDREHSYAIEGISRQELRCPITFKIR
jgi:hypothetical protein